MSSMAKIFVVINLILAVCAFGAAAVLLGAQDDYKAALLAERKASAEMKQTFQTDLARANDGVVTQTTKASEAVSSRDVAQTENEGLKGQLDEARKANQKLTSTTEKLTQEVQEMRTVYAGFKTWLEDATKSVDEATQGKLEMQKKWEEEVANRVRLEAEVGKLQEEVSSLGAQKGDLEKAGRTTRFWLDKYRERYGDITDGPQGAAGRVQSVAGNLVSISVGSADGVRIGDTYQLSRGATHVGQIVITKVHKNLAVGRFDSQYKGSGAPAQQHDRAEPRKY